PSTVSGPEAAMHPGVGGDPGLSQSLDTLAHALPTVDGSSVANAGTLASSQTVRAAHSLLDPSWLAAGALARAEGQEPLPRPVRCRGCRRELEQPKKFCGYCG